MRKKMIGKWWKSVCETWHEYHNRNFWLFFGVSILIFLPLSLWLSGRWPWSLLRYWLFKYYRAYAFSVLFGAFFTFLFSEFLHFYVERRYRQEWCGRTFLIGHRRPRLLGYLIGIVERAIITTLVGFDVAGAAGFIGGWLVTKGLGLFASSTRPEPHQRMSMFVALLNGAISVFFGIIGGIMIADP